MPDVRFSLVVPTRERAQTLKHTLRTCLEQAFEDYEIVVSDNFSSPATREVIDALGSDRIRYFRTERPLAMSDNWEFALTQAAGEYVVFIGDDDGLLVHALPDLDRILTALGERSLHWRLATYRWPDILVREEADQLAIPLGRALEVFSSLEIASDVVHGRRNITSLPSLYHGVVHRDLIARLQRRGRVFGGSSPDIYSGFAFAHLVKTFAWTERPFTMSGASGHSNGVASLLVRTPTEITREFHQLNTAAGRSVHPKAPNLVSLPACLADMFFQVEETLFPDGPFVSVDRKTLALRALAATQPADDDEYRRAVQEIQRSLSDVPQLVTWFDTLCRDYSPPISDDSLGPRWGFDGSFLTLDASLFGVTDIYGAVKLCELLLARARRPLEIPNQAPRLTAYRRLRTAARIMLKGR